MTSKWPGEAELSSALEDLTGINSRGSHEWDEKSNEPINGSIRIENVVDIAFKYQNEFKMVVYEIEKFIKKSINENKLPGLFIIIIIIRSSISMIIDFIII